MAVNIKRGLFKGPNKRSRRMRVLAAGRLSISPHRRDSGQSMSSTGTQRPRAPYGLAKATAVSMPERTSVATSVHLARSRRICCEGRWKAGREAYRQVYPLRFAWKTVKRISAYGVLYLASDDRPSIHWQRVVMMADSKISRPERWLTVRTQVDRFC